MKPHKKFSLTKALPHFRRLFPKALLEQMEQEFLPPGNYTRSATPSQLVQALLKAIVWQLPSQREIVRHNPTLGLCDPSSLSYDLERQWLSRFVAELNCHLASTYPTARQPSSRPPRLLIDTMPVMIPKTQRGRCAKFNNVAKGCGVMCTFNLDADPLHCPVELVMLMHGGWNDTSRVRQAPLIAQGPIYIADRGFYSLQTIRQWRDNNVHFIVRAKKQNLTWSVLESRLAKPTRAGKLMLESDQIVMLAKPSSSFGSKVRLLRAFLPGGEDLWLVTDQWQTDAKQLLADYQQRGTIEVYHRFVKQSLGLAHLYSFDQQGIECQIQLTILMANLLYLAATAELTLGPNVLDLINTMLNIIRQRIGLWKPWKRNTFPQKRRKPPHNRRHLKTQSTRIYKP